jgi:gluconokinase
MTENEEKPLIVVMGVAGSGKTTIASGLAQRLGVPFVEGDSLHPPANGRRPMALA